MPGIDQSTPVYQPLAYRYIQYEFSLYSIDNLKQLRQLYKDGLRAEQTVAARSMLPDDYQNLNETLRKFLILNQRVLTTSGHDLKNQYDLKSSVPHMIYHWYGITKLNEEINIMNKRGTRRLVRNEIRFSRELEEENQRAMWPDYPTADILTEANYQMIKNNLTDLDGNSLTKPLPLICLWIANKAKESKFQVVLHKSDHQMTFIIMTPEYSFDRECISKDFTSEIEDEVLSTEEEDDLDRERLDNIKSIYGVPIKDRHWIIRTKQESENELTPHELPVRCGTPQAYVEVVEFLPF